MATAVRKDSSRTLMFAAYLLFMGALGVTILGVSYWLEWGFLGYTAGAVALLAGGGGISAMAAGGGAWIADCPSCGEPIKWSSGQATFNQDKIVACPHCQTWVLGNSELAVIEAGYVHTGAIFPAAVGDTLHWPDGCPTCAAATTRTVEIEGRNALGSAAMALGGGGVQRVWVVQAPACADHDDGVLAFREGDTGRELWFRSFDFRQAFVALNPPEPQAEAQA